MSDKSIFADRLSQRRIELKYTQETFSAKVGMSRARYANYEQSRREPDFDIVKLFADHLKCTTDYLLGRTDHPGIMLMPQNEQPAPHQTEDQELLELARKLKNLPEKDRQIVETIIKLNESKEESSAAVGK